MVLYRPPRLIRRGASWQLCYYAPSGERRRISAGKNHQQAQRMCFKFTDWLLEGKDPEVEIGQARQRAASGAQSLRELFGLFMERHGKTRSAKMQRSYHGSFGNFCRCPQIADVPLSVIRKGVVLDYMHARMKQDGVCAGTVNKDVAFLRCLLGKAVEWDILDRNPLEGMAMLKTGPKREVHLGVEDVKALIDALPEPIARIVEFAVYTGFRKDNILSLRIEAIRFHDVTSTGEAELVIKGARRELFPLGPAAIEVAQRAIGVRTQGYVFINPQTGTRYYSINKAFDRAVRDLGLTIGDGTKLRFHDLRHVFATWLHREGVSLDSLRFLLGHRDRATTDRYTTVDRLEMRNVLSLMPNVRASGQEKAPSRHKDEVLEVAADTI